jgi:hypothetical protein
MHVMYLTNPSQGMMGMEIQPPTCERCLRVDYWIFVQYTRPPNERKTPVES